MVNSEDVAHSKLWMQSFSSPLLLMLSVPPASSLIVSSPLDQKKDVGLTRGTEADSQERWGQRNNAARTMKPNSLCQINFPKDINLLSFSVPSGYTKIIKGVQNVEIKIICMVCLHIIFILIHFIFIHLLPKYKGVIFLLHSTSLVPCPWCASRGKISRLVFN